MENNELEKQYPWFKMHSKGWLTGTIRAFMTMEERSVWADLLALANESRVRGVICRAKGIPYDRAYLAQWLGVPLEALNSTIEKCCMDQNVDNDLHRIEIDESGCLHITNWGKYQAVPVNKRLIPETATERELRERRKVRQDVKRYPKDAKEALSEAENKTRLESQSKTAIKHIKEMPLGGKGNA